MTELEWQRADRPTGMLLFLRARASERKKLLFDCACCRHVWSKLGQADQLAVIDAEQCADDPVAIQQMLLRLEPERKAALEVAGLGNLNHFVSDSLKQLLTDQTSLRIHFGSHRDWGIGSLAFEAARLAATTEFETSSTTQAIEESVQAEFVREIFGNPFRPITLDSGRLTSTVIDLAQAIYDERAFDCMPILADALMDAGCDSKEIIAHCRGDAPHVRGCWLVDLIIEKY